MTNKGNWPTITTLEGLTSNFDAKIEKGLLANDLEPIKCACGSTQFKDVTTSRLDNLECEKDRYCKECKLFLGSWAYGSWLP